MGVFLDQHLNWNTHIAHTIKKGTTWSSQIRRAAAPSWGIMPKYACKLYISVAILKMLYAVDVWGMLRALETLGGHQKGTGSTVNKLMSVQ